MIIGAGKTEGALRTSTDLTPIGKRACRQADLVFTSLYHHVTDLDNLRACYRLLDGNRAVGVDGVTKEQYEENLEENLHTLSDRLKRMGYRPQLRRRSYIPKPGSEKVRCCNGLRVAWQGISTIMLYRIIHRCALHTATM